MKIPSTTLTFLGTGTSQGVPVIGSKHPVCQSTDMKDKRLRVSVLIQWEDFNYVIDCGPDFRTQMLAAGIDRLDGILYTHEHADHTSGLDDIRPFSFNQGEIPLYGTSRVLDALKRRFDYIFNKEEKYPGTPSVSLIEINPDQPFYLGMREVIPVLAYHNFLPIVGYRFGNLAYLTDVKSIPEGEFKKLDNLEVLILNALRKEAHPSHLNLQEALNLVDKIKPQQAYFTHISHHMGFHEEVEKELPKGVFLAYDGLCIKCS